MKNVLTALNQIDFPDLLKDSEADTGNFKYSYISLKKIHAEIMPLLKEAGLILVHSSGVNELGPYLESRIMHIDSGDFTSTTIPLAMDRTGPQALGSSLTYMRRYNTLTLCNLVAEDDDDGAAAQGKPTTKVTVDQINACQSIEVLNALWVTVPKKDMSALVPVFKARSNNIGETK